MSATKLPREVAGLVATGAAHVVRHPMESAAYAVGLVRGAATAAIRLASGEEVGPGPGSGASPASTGTPTAGVTPQQADAEAQTSTEPPREPQRVGLEPGERLAAEAEEMPTPADLPGRVGETFQHDPQASSRDSEHGGPGDDSDIDTKNWREDVDGGPDVTTPVGTTGAGEGFNPDTDETGLQQPDTEPLMDPSLTKSVKSESETMRDAAVKNPDS